MKICAIICEFNPFHNGHGYLLRRAREICGCDALICIMSGQFTQRGEACRIDKFLRAEDAVLCGADAVVELPTPFAVAPAEIFAAGGIKTALSVGDNITLAFGCECGTSTDFLNAAKLLIDESESFKLTLSENLNRGESYIKSYSAAFEACGGKPELLSSPNNLLGVEYAKSALLQACGGVELLPIERVGSGYSDTRLFGTYSSASAIRENASNPDIAKNMPESSYKHFVTATDNRERFERLAADMLFMADKQDLKRIYGCTEGLENRLKSIATGASYADIIGACTSRRYSSSRIKRILCANLLGLYADETNAFLKEKLPLKVLAVKKQSADKILPLLSQSTSDGDGGKCEQLTLHAYDIWRHLSAPTVFNNVNQKMILV